MLYHKQYLKFVFIGAGSSFFTMRLVGDILSEPSLQSGHLALVDIHEGLLNETKTAVENLVGYAGGKFTVSAHTEVKAALNGADFVFFTFATGGYERWKNDIEICTSHGVLQSVGDTIGPGGIIRTLRTIPAVLDIAGEMEKRCPGAWIINYSNPEGAVCLALQKYTKIKSFGLCHGTPDTARWIAEKVFQVDPARLHFRAAGINHLTWFTNLTLDGVDVYPQLMEELHRSGMDKEEPISAELFRTYGLYPAPGDRHVGEFFPFFLKDQVLLDHDYAWKNNDFAAIDGWRSNLRQLFDEVRVRNTGYEKFLEGSGETATHFIRALVTGETASEMVNVINRGYIENISNGVIVELPAFIDSFGLHPQKIGALPDGIAHKCDTLGCEYLLAVDAAVTCDYSKALQAMYLDPLVSNCNYPDRLLKDLVKANLDVLPESWGNFL
ncbi:family 4 glycosyl hydrolase [Paenibacillus sp. URB8-2]|uniref:family 4 glycosyl hydrolase n=1 Tax=Paenibacillus sp. URB8-2 TaxID=2741301 RepID=UPI0015BEEC72|nr:alpha-glucosidase/alpha-galactosidase [Paenibacillus sp. URB8-2]